MHVVPTTATFSVTPTVPSTVDHVARPTVGAVTLLPTVVLAVFLVAPQVKVLPVFWNPVQLLLLQLQQL